MTNDYKNNPWRDCKLPAVSNEFRHDATARLGVLIPKIKEFDEALAEIFKELHLDIPHTLKNVDHIISVLHTAQTAHKIPAEWILTDELQPLFDEIAECKELKRRLLACNEALANEYSVIRANDPRINLASTDLLNNAEALRQEQSKLTGYLCSTTPYEFWSINEIDNITQIMNQAAETARSIHTQKDLLLKSYEPNVFDLDYQGILARIKTEYTSFTKLFKKEYKHRCTRGTNRIK